jgi:hypothetical protein
MAVAASADTVRLNDGTRLDGMVQKIDGGKVFLCVDGQTVTRELRDVKSMDFDNRSLIDPAEAEAVIKNLKELDRAEAEVRRLLTQIKADWVPNQPIDASDTPAWNAAKEVFRPPLDRYQEVLNDLYFITLSRVDRYNALAKDASNVYVGVKGIRIGSALIPSELEHLPLKKYVPAPWYERIFDDGYNIGFSDGTQKSEPRY